MMMLLPEESPSCIRGEGEIEFAVQADEIRSRAIKTSLREHARCRRHMRYLIDNAGIYIVCGKQTQMSA